MAQAQEIQQNEPLRLAEAAKIAFPRGGMTVSGLRREIARGRLAVEVIAGKQFTTLADIEKMRQTCRVQAKASDSILEPNGATPPENYTTPPLGQSATEAGKSARDALKAKLQKRNKS